MRKEKNKGILIGILIGIIVTLLAFIVLFFTNTISFNLSKQNNKYNSNEELEEKNKIDNNNYLKIIEEYKTAMNDQNFDLAAETEYLNINRRTIHDYHNYKNGYYEGEMTVKYAYYDINKDNKDELIIIESNSTKQYNIAEIYTNNNKKFISDTCLGERCYVDIYDDGTIFFYGSVGVFEHGLTFYKIASDGHSKEEIESYSVKIDENRNITITNKDKNITNFKSDEEAIKNITKTSNKVDLSKLNWIEIK